MGIRFYLFYGTLG